MEEHKDNQLFPNKTQFAKFLKSIIRNNSAESILTQEEIDIIKRNTGDFGKQVSNVSIMSNIYGSKCLKFSFTNSLNPKPVSVIILCNVYYRKFK